MSKVSVVVLICVLFSGCTTPPPTSKGSVDLSPMAVVMHATDRPWEVSVVMEIKATGTQDGNLYLNSELDYRDQRNLSIAVPEAVARQLQAKLGGSSLESFKNRRIRVTGPVQRVKIWLFFNGVKTDKYYYQTHVKVSDASQIAFL